MTKIEKIKISLLKNNPDNPRVIKDKKFEKLVKSIKEFPEMLEIRPIVIDENFFVLGGNMRLKACKEAGLVEVPVLQVNDLNEEQKKEFIIKDNINFGEWDWDILQNAWDLDNLKEWALDTPGLDADFFGGEDILEEENDDNISAKNQVIITLTMSKDVYFDVENKIDELTKNNKQIICRIQN